MEKPVVTIEQGQLLGKIAKDIRGENYYSFQGIPYAKPPLGELRFKVPQPPEPWTGIRDATTEGSECYARHMILKETIIGSEDCLVLNVYTSKLDKSSDSSSLKPVMVWVHGGAFICGSSKTELYGPEYLLIEDVVVVTFNYRLGILGFLSMDDWTLGVTGNAGLKDMVMALEWVQKNIKQFNGDPNNVTIFGESAGSAAVHYLMLSPKTKGLFHRAIAQSGSALNTWAKGRNISADLAEILDLKTTNEEEILKVLRSLSVEKLFEVGAKVNDAIASEELFIVNQVRAFAPVVEKKFHEEPFLLEEPLNIILEGNFHKVPFMTGFTSNEGLLLKVYLKSKEMKCTNNFELAIPYFYNLEPGSNLSKLIAEKIKNFYCNENFSPTEKLDKYFLLQSDNMFIREIIKVAKAYQAFSLSPIPIYLYRMSVESTLNIYKNLGGCTDKGACHADDIGYLFKTSLTPEIAPNSVEDISMKRFVKLWTNFARYGDPNPKVKDPLINVTWKPFTKKEMNYLDIGEELTVGVNPEADRIAFWDEIEEFIRKEKLI